MKITLHIIVLFIACISCSETKGDTTFEKQTPSTEKAEPVKQLTDESIKNTRSHYSESQNKLYQPLIPEEIKISEFAHLLNSMDTLISHWNGSFNTSVITSCNAKGDLDIEACNCSSNIYISTGVYDLPNEHHLFRIGPYQGLEIDSLSKKELTLYFKYSIKNKRVSKKIRIHQRHVNITN